MEAATVTECPMGLRPTKMYKDAVGRCRGINDLCRVFNRVPMGLRATNGDENGFEWEYNDHRRGWQRS